MGIASPISVNPATPHLFAGFFLPSIYPHARLRGIWTAIAQTRATGIG
jgi:hypothetical protein